MTESAVLIGRTHPLVSIITEPRRLDPSRPAVIVLNAGLVHHIGPGRWGVRLARRLADLGFLAVRFDHGGIGDTDARRDGLPFDQSSVAETREVIEHLHRAYGVQRFVLAGLCSGAGTAVFTAIEEPRVCGAVLINLAGDDGGAGGAAEAFLDDSAARRYWSISLIDPRAWWRALTGRIEYRRLTRVLLTALARRIRPSDEAKKFVDHVAALIASAAGGGARLLFLSSARDAGEPFVESLLNHPRVTPFAHTGLVTRASIAGTDHTFSFQASQDQLLEAIVEFIAGLPAEPRSQDAGAASGREAGAAAHPQHV